jgi:hypothetical protein
MKKRIINNFKTAYLRIINSFIADKNENSIEYWRKFVFYSMILFIVSIGTILVVPGVFFNLYYAKIYAAIIDILFIAVIYIIVFIKTLPYKIKTYIGSYIIYVLGVSMLIIKTW